jgi:hypothetical protein
MNEPNIPEAGPSQNADVSSALFAHLIMQQANMAMMMAGKVAHPETGQTMHDLEGAKLFIDTLEMLESKTRGNLSQPEQNMLKQTLMTVRMAFVEAANAATSSPSAGEKSIDVPDSGAGKSQSSSSAPPDDKTSPPIEERESHKKFTKKY